MRVSVRVRQSKSKLRETTSMDFMKDADESDYEESLSFVDDDDDSNVEEKNCTQELTICILLSFLAAVLLSKFFS